MSYTQIAKLDEFNNRFSLLLQKESERGSAVLVVCYIDQYTNRVLDEYHDRAELIQDLPESLKSSPGRLKRLFRKGLATLPEVERLQRLRDIRNVFAHELDAETFAYPAVVAYLGTSPELAREAFRTLLAECSTVLGNLLYTPYLERHQAYLAYHRDRRYALQVLGGLDAGHMTAAVTEREDDSLTLETHTGHRFRVGNVGERPSRVREFSLAGSDWIAVNDPGTDDDVLLTRWIATRPLDEWGIITSEAP